MRGAASSGGAAAPDPAPAPDDADKAVLDGIGTLLLVAGDRDGHAEEGGIALPVEHLDLLQQLVSASRHTPYDRDAHGFL